MTVRSQAHELAVQLGATFTKSDLDAIREDLVLAFVDGGDDSDDRPAWASDAPHAMGRLIDAVALASGLAELSDTIGTAPTHNARCTFSITQIVDMNDLELIVHRGVSGRVSAYVVGNDGIEVFAHRHLPAAKPTDFALQNERTHDVTAPTYHNMTAFLNWWCAKNSREFRAMENSERLDHSTPEARDAALVEWVVRCLGNPDNTDAGRALGAVNSNRIAGLPQLVTDLAKERDEALAELKRLWAWLTATMTEFVPEEDGDEIPLPSLPTDGARPPTIHLEEVFTAWMRSTWHVQRVPHTESGPVVPIVRGKWIHRESGISDPEHTRQYAAQLLAAADAAEAVHEGPWTEVTGDGAAH